MVNKDFNFYQEIIFAPPLKRRSWHVPCLPYVTFDQWCSRDRNLRDGDL